MEKEKGFMISVPTPVVVNTSKNVAQEGLTSKIEYSPVTEDSYKGKGNFLRDDEDGVMASKRGVMPDDTESVSRGREMRIESFDFDNREDGR